MVCCGLLRTGKAGESGRVVLGQGTERFGLVWYGRQVMLRSVELGFGVDWQLGYIVTW